MYRARQCMKGAYWYCRDSDSDNDGALLLLYSHNNVNGHL